MGPGTATPCTTFTLLVTEGALARLPEPMLRAVLAHELGHVALQHTGKNTRANEAAADQFAATLLKRLEPGYPDACVQLVYVLAVLGQQGPLAAPWFATHPSQSDARRPRSTAAIAESTSRVGITTAFVVML
jgi:Zn-dependent protease with chaperone function